MHRQGIDAGACDRVVALVPAGAVPVVCEPVAAKRRPGSDYDAKFSLPYAVASGLLRGRLGLADLLPAALIAEPCAAADGPRGYESTPTRPSRAITAAK